MKNVQLGGVEGIERDVLAIGTDYAPGTLLEMHSHRRAQFLYGATGLMEVGTADGAAALRGLDTGYEAASGAHGWRQHAQPVHRSKCCSAPRTTLRDAAGLGPAEAVAAGGD